MCAGDGEGLVVRGDPTGYRAERPHRTWPFSLEQPVALVLEPPVHEDPLDPVGGQIEVVTVEEYEIGVLPDFDAPDPVLEHHRARSVDGHDLERLVVGEPVSRQEGPVLAEILEVLVRHVRLDAGVNAGVQKVLQQVQGLRITPVLDDHHRPDDRNDLGSGEQLGQRKDLLRVGERQAIEEAVLPREAQNHHHLARIVRVGVHHDLAPDHGREGLQALVGFRRRSFSGGVRFLLPHVAFRAAEVLVRGGIPPHHRLRRLAGPQVDQRPHRHLQIHVGLEDHLRAGGALQLERHRLPAGDDAAARARDQRRHAAGERHLEHGIRQVEVFHRLPLGGHRAGNARAAGTVEGGVHVGVDQARDHRLRFVDRHPRGNVQGFADRLDDPVPDQDLAVLERPARDGVDRPSADEGGLGLGARGRGPGGRDGGCQNGREPSAPAGTDPGSPGHCRAGSDVSRPPRWCRRRVDRRAGRR